MIRILQANKITDLHPVGEDPESLIVEEEPAARLENDADPEHC
jgi:hypothetical protein